MMIVSSPPYSGNEKSDYLMSDDGKTRRRDLKRGFRQGSGCFRGSEGAYGSTVGQLGVLREGHLSVEQGIAMPTWEESTWEGCYDGNWKGIIVPDAYRHPAKFARGLIQRIYRHMLERGYVRPGQTIVDPFGGVALGAVDAMENGLRWVGVELEAHFCTLGQANLALWAKRWGLTGGTLLRGYSRRLCEVLSEAGACVSSPPYAAIETGRPVGKGEHLVARKREALKAAGYSDEYIAGIFTPGRLKHSNMGTKENYGQSPGQLGQLPAGDVGAVLSSPPYAESIGRENGIDYAKSADPNTSKQGSPARDSVGGPYGVSPGQLGAMPAGDSILSSPPYEESRVSPDSNFTSEKYPAGQPAREAGAGYGVVSSPPFGDQNDHERPLDSTRNKNGRHSISLPYGDANGQLGSMPYGGHLDSTPDRSTMYAWNDTAKTAESRSERQADGASDAATPTSQQVSREGQSQQDTASESLTPEAASPCLDIGEHSTSTGTVAATAGEDSTGERNEGSALTETDTDAAGVGRQNGSKSTTKRTSKRRKASGTTRSKTSKRSAPNATSPITESNGTTPCVQTAGSITKPATSSLTVPQNAERPQQSEHRQNSTERSARPTHAKSAANNSGLQVPDGNTVPRNVCVGHGTVSAESADLPSTFWESARLIVIQCAAILPPGAYAAFVTKDFVRDKQRVPFSDQWRQLCEACGFTTVEWIKASLVKETTHATLFDGYQTKRKERKSFFRRLAEKNGSPRIDHEDVLILRRTD